MIEKISIERKKHLLVLEVKPPRGENFEPSEVMYILSESMRAFHETVFETQFNKKLWHDTLHATMSTLIDKAEGK